MDKIGIASLALTTLTIIFIVLKICGEVAWSWWWVFSPILIPAAMLFLVVIFGISVLLYFKLKRL